MSDKTVEEKIAEKMITSYIALRICEQCEQREKENSVCNEFNRGNPIRIDENCPYFFEHLIYTQDWGKDVE